MSIRKDEGGDGWVIAERTVKIAMGALALIGFAGGVIGAAVRNQASIAAAVPRTEFLDTMRATRAIIREHIQIAGGVHASTDSTIAHLARDVKLANQQNRSLLCYVNDYPAGLCDDVPRKRK